MQKGRVAWIERKKKASAYRRANMQKLHSDMQPVAQEDGEVEDPWQRSGTPHRLVGLLASSQTHRGTPFDVPLWSNEWTPLETKGVFCC